MKNLILTVGISGSGKTTWAKNFVNESNAEYVIIERDALRTEITGLESPVFKKSLEKQVTLLADKLFLNAVSEGKSVIISDTNLNSKTRLKWEEKAKEHDYSLTYKLFETTLEQAIKNNSKRSRRVPTSEIMRQWKGYVEYSNTYQYKHTEGLPEAIIVDIDGTVATMNKRTPFEWYKVSSDSPRTEILELVKYQYSLGKKVIFLSGRSSECWGDTMLWLHQNFGDEFLLYMRKADDLRRDTIVKEELFMKHIRGKYNISMIFDDRPSVVRLWYSLGFNCVLSLANPWLEF